MNKKDLILTAIALILLFIITGIHLSIILKILLGLILLCTVLHWKITPYKDQLFPRYRKYYDLFDCIFNKFQIVFQRIPKIQLGQHIQLDMSYLTIISILILIQILI